MCDTWVEEEVNYKSFSVSGNGRRRSMEVYVSSVRRGSAVIIAFVKWCMRGEGRAA